MKYTPPPSDLRVSGSTIGVKFSNDTFVAPSQLDKWGIKYEESDLEDGPFGKVLRITGKKNEK